MQLQIVGAGLPRTATSSLALALEQLLGGRILNMSAIPGHPFDLGPGWEQAMAGETPNWNQIFAGYVAAVDWPASAFWRELSEAYPNAPVLLSVRDSAATWLQSMEATILPVARLALAPDWQEGHHLTDLLEYFVGSKDWDDPATLMAAYERHNDEVRRAIAPQRLLEWCAADGWRPICEILGMPAPDTPFPWVNRREDWG